MINPITKKVFKKVIDGVVTEVNISNYIALGLEAEYLEFLEAESTTEREWRNLELSGTDYMLMPDATYNKTKMSGSSMLDDIMAYREKLRNYNLTTDPRPERPIWFN